MNYCFNTEILSIVPNVSYKNSAAIACDDFPQENQTQQVHTDFRLGTSFRIVFIRCCEIVPPVRVSRSAIQSAAFQI